MAKLIAAAVLLPMIVCLVVAITYCTVPTRNSDAQHFETLIVLGCPPDPNGTPSSEERERVREAVRELHMGRADHVIVTGGSPHSQISEATIMAQLLLESDVSRTDIVVETQARNTIENIYYSDKIMEQRGWKSAEVISSPSHLPRTALILSHYRFAWCTQSAGWPAEYSRVRIGARYLHEALGTTALRWFGFRHTPFLVSTNRAGASARGAAANARLFRDSYAGVSV